MGFVKQAKQNMVTTEAQRALEEGRRYYTPKLNTGSLQSGTSGSISGGAEMIEAVEACGWHLTDWSVACDERGRPEAYPLFRRA